MAEKIVYDIEMKGLESAKRGLEEITKIQYQQREAIKQSNEALKAYEKELRILETQVGEAGTATEEQVKQQKELTASIDSTVIELQSQKDELANIKKVRRQAVDVLNAHNTVINAEIGSNEQLRAQLKILTAEYDKMSQEERDNTDAGRELASETLNITNKLKENEKAVGDNRRNVGNYEAAITSALGKINIMGVNLGELTQNIREGYETGMQLVDAMKAQAAASQATAVATRAQAAASQATAVATRAQGAASQETAVATRAQAAASQETAVATSAQAAASQSTAVATSAQGAATVGTTAATGGLSKAMNILKISLISTGIGAIVVALGLLVAGFLSTQRGADAVARVLEPLKVIMSSLWGVVQKLGTAMVDAFKNPQQLLKSMGNLIYEGLIKPFTGVLEIMKGMMTFNFNSIANGAQKVTNGVKNIVDGIKNGAQATSEFMRDAIKKGQQVAALQKQIEQAENDLILAKDEYEDKERDLLMITEDTSKSYKERGVAAEKIIKLAEQYAVEEAKVKQLQIDQLKLQQSLNDTKRRGNEGQEELIKLEMELDDINDAAEEKRLEQMKVLSGLKKEQNELIQESINKEKERLASIAEINRTTNEQLKFELDEKLKLLKLNRDDAKLTKDELAAKTKLTQDYYAEVNQGETERIEKLEEFIKIEDLTAQGKKQAALEELDLLKDVTEMTELEFAARTKINEQYFEDLSKEHYNFIKSELERQKDYLTEDSLKLELKYLQDLRLTGDNAEEKERINKEYQEKTINAQKEAIDAQMQIINSEINQLKATLGDGLDISPLKESEVKKLEQELIALGIEAEKAKAALDQVTKPKEVDPNAPISLADRLGIDPDKLEGIKASYQGAVDAIQLILSNANQRITQETNERVSKIDTALKAGTISEGEAEKEKQKIRKDSFEKQKKLQKTSATISYFTGLINAIAQSMQFPPPFNAIVGAISSGILTGVYKANIKQIDSQKFEDGGLIQGAPHSKGGVPFTVQGRGGFEAEGGEFIQNKKAVQHYGTDFMQAINTMKIPKLFADGGFVAPVASGSMSSQVRQGVGALAESIVSQENRVILVETDLRKTQNKVNNVEAARTY